MNLYITNVTANLPQGLVPDTSVLIQDGRISEIGSDAPPANVCICDGGGLLLSPGFIDLHSDAIEKEIRPRPGGSFPYHVALTELDKRLAACGITRMYHCLCFGDSTTNDLRTAPTASQIAREMRDLNQELLVHNRVHIRFEVSDTNSVETVHTLIEEGAADLLSFMDHTPGQGQFTCLEHFKTYYSQAEHLTQEQAVELAHTRMAMRGQLGDDHLRDLAEHSLAKDMVLASHDDDTREKVDWVHELGVHVSEFPVTLEAASIATELGMGVLMGAPNVLRGCSLTGNLSGREAIKQGVCDILGSDYAPMSLLHAAVALAKDKVCPLDKALAKLSSNPADAMNLGGETGRIAVGLSADLVLIDLTTERVPRIVRTWVGGREVYAAPPHARPQSSSLQQEHHLAYSNC